MCKDSDPQVDHSTVVTVLLCNDCPQNFRGVQQALRFMFLESAGISSSSLLILPGLAHIFGGLGGGQLSASWAHLSAAQQLTHSSVNWLCST